MDSLMIFGAKIVCYKDIIIMGITLYYLKAVDVTTLVNACSTSVSLCALLTLDSTCLSPISIIMTTSQVLLQRTRVGRQASPYVLTKV